MSSKDDGYETLFIIAFIVIIALLGLAAGQGQKQARSEGYEAGFSDGYEEGYYDCEIENGL